MNEPEGTGSDREREPKKDIVLPSWIDAAISRTQDSDSVEGAEEPAPLPEEAVEPMPDELPTQEYRRPSPDELPTQEYPRPTPEMLGDEPPSTEPFPSFLDRRGSMEYETERITDEPAHAEPIESIEPAEPELISEYAPRSATPPDFLARRAADEFEAQRAAIVTQAMAEDPLPHPEPIPLPVAPPRRRAPSGPWLMAAIFFAAAALVLAILIWLRPLPQ